MSKRLALALLCSGCTGDLFARELKSEPIAAAMPAMPAGREPDPVLLPPFAPADLRQRRLLGREYVAAISQLLGPDAAAHVRPPPDSALHGFDAVGNAELALTPAATSAYAQSADDAVKAFDDPSRRGALVGCTPSSVLDRTCMQRFAASFGRRAFRRSLTSAEVERWVALGLDAAQAFADFHRGAAAIAWGMLQSPHFLYLVELGSPEGERLKLSGPELAARLSFFALGRPPDDLLLEAAEAGELDTADGAALHAGRLLDRLDAHSGILSVFDEMLRLREVDRLAKNPQLYPAFTAALPPQMRAETQMLLRYFVFDGHDFRDVLDAPFSFVTSDLARLYGLSGSFGSYLAPVDFPLGSPRVGLLGQASLLALNAHPSSTSPTLRGKFVLERLICQTVPPPPPDVDTTLPPDPQTGPRTMRERLAAHRADPACASCHRLTDEVGLALEHFDTFGRWRDDDQGLPLDVTGSLYGKPFEGLIGLAATLKADPRFPRCVARNFFRAATGRVETAGEALPLSQVDGRFAASGYRVREMLVALAASDAFRYGKAALP